MFTSTLVGLVIGHRLEYNNLESFPQIADIDYGIPYGRVQDISITVDISPEVVFASYKPHRKLISNMLGRRYFTKRNC